jgi:hypothetical protein
MDQPRKILFTCLLSCTVFLLSCSGAQESEIAKKITFATSSVAIVLPNNLTNSDTVHQTCIAGGVAGPRVRLNATITWNGTDKLLPLFIKLSITDDRLAAIYNGSVSPSSAGDESLAGVFGLSTDYIPAGTTVTTNACFLDFGGLPKPVTTLKGASQLQIPAILSMTGVVRDSSGNDTPFVKEINATLTYVAGSAN